MPIWSPPLRYNLFVRHTKTFYIFYAIRTFYRLQKLLYFVTIMYLLYGRHKVHGQFLQYSNHVYKSMFLNTKLNVSIKHLLFVVSFGSKIHQTIHNIINHFVYKFPIRLHMMSIHGDTGTGGWHRSFTHSSLLEGTRMRIESDACWWPGHDF